MASWQPINQSLLAPPIASPEGPLPGEKSEGNSQFPPQASTTPYSLLSSPGKQPSLNTRRRQEQKPSQAQHRASSDSLNKINPATPPPAKAPHLHPSSPSMQIELEMKNITEGFGYFTVTCTHFTIIMTCVSTRAALPLPEKSFKKSLTFSMLSCTNQSLRSHWTQQQWRNLISFHIITKMLEMLEKIYLVIKWMWLNTAALRVLSVLSH